MSAARLSNAAFCAVSRPSLFPVHAQCRYAQKLTCRPFTQTRKLPHHRRAVSRRSYCCRRAKLASARDSVAQDADVQGRRDSFVADDGEQLGKQPILDRMRELVTEVKYLGSSFWRFEKSAWRGWAWATVTLVLALANTLFTVCNSFLLRMFWTALSSKDQAKFARLLKLYIVAVIVGPIIITLFKWAKARLSLLWREQLTTTLLKDYMRDLQYYKLSFPAATGSELRNGAHMSLATSIVDNPDQRIAEDVRTFTTRAVDFLCVVVIALIDLVLFSVILFRIYKPLYYALLGYSAVCTTITVVFGQKLVALNETQLTKEANMRYALLRVRENSESIAFYRGAASERKHIGRKLQAVLSNSFHLISFDRNLGFFTLGYRYVIQVLPSVLITPLYFAGKIQLGVISQANFAFNHVLGDLGLVVEQFSALSEFSAGVKRLHDFRAALDKQQLTVSREAGNFITKTEASELALALTPTKSSIVTSEEAPSGGAALAVESLSICTPGARPRELVQDLSLTLSRGARLLVTGESGIGKSSVMRTIAGLWTSGSGLITRPPISECLFLSQRPYIRLGTLKENAAYPSDAGRFSDAQVNEALTLVNLPGVAERLGGLHQSVDDMGSILSLGEQQRLAFARVWLNRPSFVILDESTSALDELNEERVYDLISQNSTLTVVSVSNRASVRKHHTAELHLMPAGRWSFRNSIH
mmetsp:Transcript_3522/g.9703  ORF Transcript_3522/g.9703 Transcript_3522/m.9703 type:complete len:702 (-) Transcript_3522:105-2210(-)